jgi:hypothetical protein
MPWFVGKFLADLCKDLGIIAWTFFTLVATVRGFGTPEPT